MLKILSKAQYTPNLAARLIIKRFITICTERFEKTYIAEICLMAALISLSLSLIIITTSLLPKKKDNSLEVVDNEWYITNTKNVV